MRDSTKLAVCPPGAAPLQIPEAQRFHRVHYQDVTGLAALLLRETAPR